MTIDLQKIIAALEQSIKQLKQLFPPHVNISIIARDPNDPESAVIASNDNYEEVAKAFWYYAQKQKLMERPDGHLHTMPTGGRPHQESEMCWCVPDLIGDYTKHGGRKHFLHKEVQ